jgi:GNAT superfamily N-acetyltransferase
VLTPPEKTKRAPSQVQLVAWGSLHEADAEAIRALYEEAFPATERRVFAEVVATCDRMWVAKSGADVTGFATAAVLPNANSALLQYLAVATPFRSAGIGSLLLAHIERDLCRPETALDGVYVEIEPPNGPEENSEAKRRLAFYVRWGAEPVTCMPEYFIADFSSESAARVPMFLLWRSLNGDGQPKGDRLRAALSDIYESEYSGCADANFLPDILGRVRC